MTAEIRAKSRLGNELSLPPGFSLVTLREVGDAFAHAKANAAKLGAGTLVFVGRFDLSEFAVVLEPDEPLATARRAFYPLIVASQTIPILVVAPIFVLWFGYGIGPKLAIIALICFFPITVNTLDGLRAVDPDAVKMMRTLDASRWQIFSRVEAPTALPYAFSGAKIAVAVAVIGAVFGEWAGADSGLGFLILNANAQLLTARVFAAVVVLSAFAIGLFALLALLERRVVRWR
jgi:ABC-type nitrate/sulfonate/bicarbonate transport system permease component